jgi:hypothetical protein
LPGLYALNWEWIEKQAEDKRHALYCLLCMYLFNIIFFCFCVSGSASSSYMPAQIGGFTAGILATIALSVPLQPGAY